MATLTVALGTGAIRRFDLARTAPARARRAPQRDLRKARRSRLAADGDSAPPSIVRVGTRFPPSSRRPPTAPPAPPERSGRQPLDRLPQDRRDLIFRI